MRIRQEAKILKNHRRELTFKVVQDEYGDYDYPVSRYKPMRVCQALMNVVKAYRRRQFNLARRARKNGEILSYKLAIHNGCSVHAMEDACAWWNIPT